MSCRVAIGPLVAAGVVLAACHRGGGSDIGPKLTPITEVDYRVTVFDDAGAPVTGAVVTVLGSTARSVTGERGRAFLRGAPSGTRVVGIDGTHAAATAQSMLGTVQLRAPVPGNRELPFVAYLPDVGGSATLTLPAGVQPPGTSPLDDTAVSGVILGIPDGETVGDGSASVTLRVAKLAAEHVPPTFDRPGTTVTSRAFLLHPESVQFAIGARVSVPADELALTPSQSVLLYRLNPTSGSWEAVGSGVESAGRVVAPDGSVKSGGLYCFATSAPATTRVVGKVVDSDGLPVDGVLVRAPQAFGRTLGDGIFALDVARPSGGADRTVRLELTGGRYLLPVRAAVDVPITSASVDIGTQSLPVRRSANVRVLMIDRGRRDSYRRLRGSAARGLTVGDGNGGEDAVVEFEEMAADTVGFLTTKPRDEVLIARSWARYFVVPYSNDYPVSIWASEEVWRPDARGGTVLQAYDSFGTGPVYGVGAVLGTEPKKGYLGFTDFNGFIGAGIPNKGQITTVHRTERDGRTVIAAFTVVAPDTGRLEIPVERARHQRLGSFRRFGIYRGDLTGSAGGNTRRIRASGAMTEQDFYDQVFLGRTPRIGVPVFEEPSASSTSYRLGLARGTAHLVAVEGNAAGSAFTLDRMGIRRDLSVQEGTTTSLDVPLDLLATSTFTFANARVDRHPAIDDAAMWFDVAARLPDGLILDIARGIGGTSLTSSGSADLALRLPPLPTALSHYLVGVGGRAVVGGATITQQIYGEIDGVAVPTRAMMPVPAVNTPAVSAVVPSTGFTVDFILPGTCHYGVLTLRSETATEVRDWTVLLPFDTASFTFRELPDDVAKVLVPGLTWKLSLTCGRVDEGALVHPSLTKSQTLHRSLANWVGMPEAVRKVRAFSSVSFDVTTN